MYLQFFLSLQGSKRDVTKQTKRQQTKKVLSYKEQNLGGKIENI